MSPGSAQHGGNPMAAYGHHQQSAGPSPGGRGGWNQQAQGGFPSAGMPPQGYGNMPMPGSAGGYGHDQGSAGGWNQQPQSAGGYPRNNSQANNFGGY